MSIVTISWCFLISMGILSNSIFSYEDVEFMRNYPAPFTEHNRILGLILSFDLYHIDPLIIIFNEYVSICESGWSPTIVLYTTVNYSLELMRYCEQKLYCARTNSSIPLLIEVRPPALKTGLGAEHRVTVANELDHFDVFVYHEDDIIFKTHHLFMYLSETKKFHHITNGTGLRNHLIGFQRYRRINHGNEIDNKFTEKEIFAQELFEEMPGIYRECIGNTPYIHIQGNTHQAMWILTQQQIRYLQEKCIFLNQSSGSR